MIHRRSSRNKEISEKLLEKYPLTFNDAGSIADVPEHMWNKPRIYCITFPQIYRREKHPHIPEAHPDGWVEIHADCIDHYNKLKGRFVRQYSNVTLQSDFEKAKVYYPKGCLRVLTIKDLLEPVSLTDHLDEHTT
jgi:hypothetical protein